MSLNGTSSYVTLGNIAGLGVTNFTLEAMVYWTGGGVATSTGAGGITAIPIISKGRAESDGSNLDMNYFLGVTAAGNLAADFEDTATGLNHPVTATSVMLTNTWNHVAATYDSATGTWFLFVNGVQAGTANAGAGILPRSDSIQHAAIGTAMTSAGVAAGFFAGRIDEVRIWNAARTQAQIQTSMFTEINSGANLVARWGMAEGAGAIINSSVGSFPGTLTNAPAWHSGYPFGSAVRFDGTNDYVNFGTTGRDNLGSSTFTLESWVYRTTGGVLMGTGTGGLGDLGLPQGYPVITKGMGQGETPATVNMNYWMGIASTGVIAADFEDTVGGVNHPVVGITPIPVNTWHHIAVTYNGSCWSLFLDGNPEAVSGSTTQCPNRIPEAASLQYAALGSTLQTSGATAAASGYFPGIIDEARIWNSVRSVAEIQANIYSELTSGTGLLARWGLDEGTAITATDSVAPVQNGTLTNGPTWVPGFPFPAPVDSIPPAAPIGLTATPYSNGILLNWTANADPDLAGYNIYRSTSPSVPLVGPINGGTLYTGTTYNDGGLINGTTYYYAITAVDTSANPSAASNEVSATPLLSLGSAIQFNGSTQYSTFGVGNTLASPTYTIETWFKRTGPGVGVTTGGGGIASAIPLITKGTSEAETANVDINYFLGIDAGTGALIADFEEGAGGILPSQNHPVSGTTVIANNVWYHAAATYDGTTLNLYLNGTLEGSVVVGQPSASATTSPTAFATSIRSNGTTLQGFFQGVMDEARIWNRALPLPELQSNINTQLTSGTGMIARWGMNEGTGAVISSSVGTFDGALTNGPLWVPGAPFNLTFNAPPSAPTLVSPPDNSTDTSTSPTLSVDVSDLDGGNLTVQFYGRPVGAVAGADFSIIAIPDTQYYTSSLYGGSPAIMDTQTQWVVDNMAANNIQFVTQLGDCTEHGDQFIVEWQNADQFFQTIEDPFTTGLTYGMPYGIAPGNHDETPIGTPNGTTLYNQFFGEARFLGRDYYGGHYGANNDNHYELFSASGMDFIVVHFAYDTSANAAVLNWADNLLQTYSTRRAIIVTHWLINGGNNATYSAQGQAIYNALKDNPNLFLMLGGHVPSPAEGQRSDTFNGNTVYSLMSDYQGRTAGGNGWLRIITISPTNNNIQVKTYSPWLNQFETDADSQFSLPVNLVNSFQLIGTDTVPSGGTASVTWPGLNNSTEYEWYAVVSDGSASATSSTWSFTTEAPANVPPTITGQNPLSTNEETALTITPADLTVTDPDNVYPTGFSLTVQSGTNYTVVGTTITPALNFNGTLTVPVLVNDGTADSNIFNLSVTVNPVNDLPVITGQNPLSTNEDTNLTIVLANLLVSDVDNTYPTGFSLTVQSGANYTFTGSTITPALNFNGALTVPVIVNDGTGNSLPFNLTVTVNPVNDAPTITGQNPLSTNEDTNLTIVLANLLVTDVDNVYPTGFSLTVQSAANYTVAGATITPDAQFSGTLTVPVFVNDGTNDSNIFDLTVTVNAQNDAPTVTNPGAQTSAEGSVVSLQILAADTDIPADTLTYSATNLPQGLSINTTTGLISGTLTYHAAAGSPYNVTVTVNDGTTSSSANFTWTVSQAASGLCPNDAALVGCWQMEEGSGAFVIDGTSFGNDGAITGAPTWPAGVSGLALDLSGTAQYAMVPDSNSLDIATNKITLVAWIKPEKVATQNIIKKTIGTTTANGYELSLSAAGKVFMRLNGNALYRVDSIASYPTNGSTWMHVAATYDGTNLRIYINGVLDNTRAATLTIAPNTTNLGIGAEPTFINLYQGLLDDTRVYNRDLSLAEIQALFGNTQPTTSGIAPVNVNEDAADTSIDLWTSFADAEDADSALTYTITTNSNAALFTSASIAANQNLVLDYAPNVFGTSNITIRATDTGGMFVETTFAVTVTSVNDAPTITGQNPLSTNENTALAITLANLLVTDADNNYPTGFTLTVLSGTNYTFAGNTITPSLNFNGTLTVPVQVNDGTDNSNIFNLTVTVNAVNDVPVITGQSPLSTNEDTSLTIALTDLLVTDSDNPYPTGFSLTVQSGANYSVAGATITPTLNFNGTLTVPVRVNDGAANSNIFNLTVTVNPVNDIPSITNPGAQTNLEGATVSLPIVANDVDNASLTYSATNLPTGLAINPANGSINGAVDYTAAALSPFNVTVTVSDGVGGVASVNFNWTITDAIPPASGLVCTDLASKPATASTGEKPQSKVWQHDGIWWAVFPTNASGASSAGTWLWRLQGTTWIEELKLSNATNTKADVKTSGDVAHILLYAGTTTQLVSAEYNGASYVTWSGRAAPSNISLANSEIATIDIDSTGRMWLATENDATGQIVAYYSDSPYSTWSAPVTIATGVNNDDIATIIAMPSNQIGILWSNQNTQRFGFRIHNDGAAPGTWAADEVPASQSAQNVGLGMADDHLHMTVASDGTIYAVVKTSYDVLGYPKIALLVRRPAGTWDNLYNIDDTGTRATLMLDEVNGYLTVLYTSAEGYNPMVYKQSTIAPIAFGNRTTLRAAAFNDASASKGNYTSELVTIFANATQVSGEICAPIPPAGADLSITKTDGTTAVRPTDNVTYTIVVSNNGPQAVTGASVQDTLPAEFSSAAWTCTGTGGGTCSANGTGSINDLANLPVNASVTYTLNAQVSNTATSGFTNTATVSTPVGITDPLLANNSASDTDSIIATTAACENDPTLVGCWPMEEGSGAVILDGSIYFNDGATVNGAAWVPGQSGLALDLNGTNQYVSVPDNATLDLTTQMTVALWIRPNRQATQDLVKKAINGGTNGFEVALATNLPSSPAPSKVFVRFNQQTSGDTYRVNSVTNYPFDGATWMHVAATYDGTTIKLYINGVLESSLPANVAIATNNLPLTIGAQSDNSRYYQGSMDEVRVYNRALTIDEVQTLFGNHPPVAVTDPYTTNEDTAINANIATGVLSNDTDPDLDALTAVKDSDPINGTLVLNANGSFVYTPTANTCGNDSFTYHANDGQFNSAVTTVNLTVTCVNDVPTTSGIANVTVNEDALNSTIDLWPSFADVEDTDNLLTYTVTGNTNAALFTSVSVVGGQNLVLDYAPDQTGSAQITVRATDAGLPSQFIETTFTVTVNAVNDGPTTSGIANVIVNEDAADTSIDLWPSFADVDNADNTLTYTITGNTNAGLFTSATDQRRTIPCSELRSKYKRRCTNHSPRHGPGSIIRRNLLYGNG
ncbi:MAG: tandem-95 repeat protein [Anaerolineales bacterium]|nr:tandem-95 repeat protein [Anaerolineales bacterium]